MIFKYEMKKLSGLTLVWVFIAVTIAFNALKAVNILSSIGWAELYGELFGSFGMLLFFECTALNLLILLFITGCENTSGTAAVLFSSKTGRRLIKLKLSAAFLAGSIAFAVIYFFSYIILFSIHDLSGVWEQELSLLNGNAEAFGIVVWENITLRQFFIGGLAISYILNMIFIALSTPIALFIRNSYIAFGLVAGMVVSNLFLIAALPVNWLFYKIVKTTPLGLITENTIWFSSGGLALPMPGFETVITAFYLLLGLAFVLTGLKVYSGKDLI
ncbi:MAG: hypothetical protein FWG90_05805 [Oscillospiraceae bacterium]|nr:hypothetical protein [Oscillospiraceae bacterium]